MGVEASGGEVGVLGAGLPGGREGGFVDDGRAGDGDPFFFGSTDLAGFAAGPAVVDHLVGVDHGAADVGGLLQ